MSSTGSTHTAAAKQEAIALKAQRGRIFDPAGNTLGNKTGGRYTELGKRKKTAVSASF